MSILALILLFFNQIAIYQSLSPAYSFQFSFIIWSLVFFTFVLILITFVNYHYQAHSYKTSNGSAFWPLGKVLPPGKQNQSIKTWDGKIRKAYLSYFHNPLPKEQDMESRALPPRSVFPPREEHLYAGYVTLISHQFRTPLSIIRSNVDLLKYTVEQSKISQDAGAHRYFERINDEISRMTQMLDKMITMEQSGHKGFGLNKHPTDLVALIEKLVERRKNLSGEKIIIYVQGKNQKCSLDKIFLEQALANLIDNAIKYSQNCPLPQVRIIFRESELEIQIEDFGLGIPPQDMKQLFLPFFRAQNTRKIPGTGLGLAIARQIIDLHQGSIDCQSVLGKGTKFTIKIPKR